MESIFDHHRNTIGDTVKSSILHKFRIAILRSSFDQQDGTALVAVTNSIIQRGGAMEILLVQIGVGFEQHLAELSIAVGAGEM